MYGLTTIMGLIKSEGRTRGLAAVAMAAFIFLSALATEARAQNTYGGSTVVHGGSIGLVPGQRVSVTVPNYYLLDGSVRYAKHSIRVTERESGLIYSGESGGLNESVHEYGHIFTIRYSDLSVRGEPVTGRVQLWIEVESFPLSATENPPEDRSAVVGPPTFELIDELSGRTVLSNAFGRAVSISLRARPEMTPDLKESNVPVGLVTDRAFEFSSLVEDDKQLIVRIEKLGPEGIVAKRADSLKKGFHTACRLAELRD